MATVKKPAAKKAANKKAAAAGKAAPKKTAARKLTTDDVVAGSPAAGKKLPKLVDEYVLVSDMGNDQWEKLQAWAASSQTFVDTFTVRFKTAIPYKVYEQFMSRK